MPQVPSHKYTTWYSKKQKLQVLLEKTKAMAPAITSHSATRTVSSKRVRRQQIRIRTRPHTRASHRQQQQQRQRKHRHPPVVIRLPPSTLPPPSPSPSSLLPLPATPRSTLPVFLLYAGLGAAAALLFWALPCGSNLPALSARKRNLPLAERKPKPKFFLRTGIWDSRCSLGVTNSSLFQPRLYTALHCCPLCSYGLSSLYIPYSLILVYLLQSRITTKAWKKSVIPQTYIWTTGGHRRYLK